VCDQLHFTSAQALRLPPCGACGHVSGSEVSHLSVLGRCQLLVGRAHRRSASRGSIRKVPFRSSAFSAALGELGCKADRPLRASFLRNRTVPSDPKTTFGNNSLFAQFWSCQSEGISPCHQS